jgi:hypothetical protein
MEAKCSWKGIMMIGFAVTKKEVIKPKNEDPNEAVT